MRELKFRAWNSIQHKMINTDNLTFIEFFDQIEGAFGGIKIQTQNY
jgi:hypothetical protein